MAQMGADFGYVWRWSKWPRASWDAAGERKGQRCRLLVRGRRMNSVLVEFEDGSRFVTSANGLVVAKAATSQAQGLLEGVA